LRVTQNKVFQFLSNLFKKVKAWFLSGKIFLQLRIWLLYVLYKIHLKIRYLHDRTYSKGGWYKSYSDRRYTSTVHRTVMTAFIASFATFLFLQYVWPNIFNPAVPQEVRAGSSFKEWTTRGDFNNGTTKTNTVISGTNDNDDANIRLFNGTLDHNIKTIAAGLNHTVGLKNDGTVVALGSNMYSQLNVGSWSGIKSIAAGLNHTVGLKNDGTVVAVGNNGSGQLNVGSWTGIKSITTGQFHTVGLKNDGTVVAVGSNANGQLNVSSWTGITAVAAGARFTVGLKNDGTVVAVGSNADGQLNVSSWTGITAVAAGYGHTVGLKNDGTVVAVGSNADGQLNVGSWTGITAVAAGFYHTVGLKDDGTVVAVGKNDYGQLDVGSWTGITSIATGSSSSLSLRNNSTVQGLGQNEGISGLGSWTDIRQPSYIYSPSGSIADLKVDTTKRSSYQNLTYALTEPLPAGTSITMSVKAGDTEGAGAYTNIAGVTQIDANDPSCTEISQSSTRVCYTGNVVAPGGGNLLGQYANVQVSFTSDGNSTPTLDGIKLSYDSLEQPTIANLKNTSNNNLNEYNGSLWTNETSVKVEAGDITCTDCGNSTDRKIEAQASTDGTNFTSPITAEGTIQSEGNPSVATLNGLDPVSTYYIRARSLDAQGRASSWTVYDKTIKIDQTAPTGTISIGGPNVSGGYAKSTEIDLTISATDSGGSEADSIPNQMRLSNNGTDWGTQTNADGSINPSFADWGNYITSISGWDLLAGSDGNRTVYIQFRDNAGNVSGDWLQTSQADFDGGDKSAVITESPGSFKLNNTTESPATLRPNGVGSLNEILNRYGCTENWDCVNDVAADGDATRILVAGDWSDTDKSDLYATTNTVPIGSTINSVRVYAKMLLGEGVNKIGFKDTVGTWWDAGHELSTEFTMYDTGLRTTRSDGALWTYNDIEALEIGVKLRDANLPNIVTQVYAVIDFTQPPVTSGSLISSIKDNTSSQNYGSIYWSADVPSQTGTDALRYQVASNNDNLTWNYIGPDGTAGSYYTTSGTQLHSSHNGHRYIRYRAYLQTADGSYTPIVYDVSIGVNTSTSDTINLDTAPPAPVSNLKAYSDSGKGTEYTTSNWQTNSTPYFEWDSDSKPSDFDKYKYCLDTVAANCTPATDTTLTNYSPTLSSEGNYLFKIESYDGAGNKSVATTTFTYGYDFSPPSDVTGLNAPIGDATQDSITVRWSAATDSGSGIAGYILERKRYDSVLWSGPTYASFDLGIVTSKVDTGLTQGYKYNYRIKAKDATNQTSTNYSLVDGYTVDTIPPSDPTIVSAVPTASGASAGYEITLSWNPANDNGSGLAKYKIWRRAEANDTREVNNQGQDITNTQNQVWNLVGVISGTGPLNTTWEDNDTNNDSTDTDKTVASPRLNDYTTYHYRVVAVDGSGNHTKIITTDPVSGLPDSTNYDFARTVDVTDPSVPANLTITPTGVDTLGGDPLTQAMDISWSASTDTRTTGRTPTGNGVGIQEYELWQAKGDVNGPTEAYTLISTQSGTSFTKEGLIEDSYYYYKVMARDNAQASGYTTDNESAFSAEQGALTKNSQVPTTPTAITVTAKTGDPNTDSEVGTKIDISFTGSRIKGTGNRVDGYRIYRSTINFATQGQWTALTPIYTFNGLNIPAETQDGQRNYQDIVSGDATTYFYKVQAFGWNESNQVTEISPSLSSISVGTLHAGWDTTADTTSPGQPSEVKVKDIHGNDSMVRNIITWLVIPNPDRNGTNDFRKYEIWRYETANGIGSATKIAEKTDIGDNYHVDGISYAARNIDYSYYVVSRDNAGTEFKYQNDTIINPPYDNVSTHEAPVSINPGTVKPTVDPNSVSVTNIGVSAATINWTTNQQTDSGVEYQKKGTNNVISAGKDRTAPVNVHSVALMALEKNTEYQYRVVSRNSLGNIDDVAANTWREFKTEDFSIQNIRVEKTEITTTTAKVRWETSFAADSNVEYKPENTGDKSQTKGDVSLVNSHAVTLEGLKPATTYTYKVRSVTQDRFIDESNFLTFSTNAFDSSQFVIAPNASEIAEQNITATSAKIVWNTSIATTSWVDYGTDQNNMNLSAGDEKYNTVHVIELLNLTPGKTYYYRVRGLDTSGVEYVSKQYQFSAVLQPEIQNLKADVTSAYTATVRFNTNVDTDAVVTYQKEGGEEKKAGQTIMSKEHEIELKELEDDSTYTFFVEVKDRSNAVKKSGENSFKTPIDKEGPKVSGVKIELLPMGESDNTASVIISWVTDKPATTKVEYDEGVVGGRYSLNSVEDTTLNNSHTVIIKELQPSTTYHFRIVSKDKRNNTENSQDYNFVTPTKEKSIWQLIVKSLEETFAWVKNLGSFFKIQRERAN